MARALVWFRRDLRLADNPALAAALRAGLAPVPVYVHAPAEDGEWRAGAASRAWLHRSLHALDASLRALGSRLVVRSGARAGHELAGLARECGASAVFWNRCYEPGAIERDRRLKDGLREAGLRVESFNGSLLAEPWALRNRSGEPYKVFTPFWRTLSATLQPRNPDPAPASLPAVPDVPSAPLDALGLRPAPAWDAGFWSRWTPGEAGAMAALAEFLDGPLQDYQAHRDRPDYAGTSRLSPHLHFGEVSIGQVRHALAAQRQRAVVVPHADAFERQLGWREFAAHLLFHFPHTASGNLDPRFDRFAWAAPEPAALDAWQRGRTGVPLVDAGMRQLWQEGWMHNRVRMVVASFLTKNLRMHWSHGARWFHDTLLDADLANNTMGWQWVAGTGADAAPYFRVFNPVAQSRRFDPDGRYIRRWLPELARLPPAAVHAPWTDPASAAAGPGYPSTPIVDLAASRERALAAYRASRAVPAR